MGLFLAFFALALISSTPMASCRPDTEGKQLFASSSNTLSSANGYQVSLSQTDVNGVCTTSMTILGNGIHKVVDYPCKSAPTLVINLNKTLLVGDEYFSDTPAELVHIVGDKCEKEVFLEKDGKYTSTVAPMEEKECERIKIKIVIIKEQQEKWNEWYKQKQQEAQNQLMQVQNSLAALQQQLVSGIFGGLPFGK